MKLRKISFIWKDTPTFFFEEVTYHQGQTGHLR